MKTHLKRTSSVLYFIAVAFLMTVIGPWCAAFAIINPHGMSGMLGTSFPVPNSTTVGDLTGMTAQARQQLWVLSIVFGADTQYQEIPFANGMMGDKFSGKAIVQIKDTENVNGNTVNIPLIGGFGGEGVQGEGTRLGQEQQLKIGNMTVQIGRFWFGYSWTSIARDETVIGGPIDKIIRTGMREQFAKKKNDDIMMKFINTAGVAGRNYMLPPGITSRAGLKGTDVFSTQCITIGSLALSGIGGKPWDTSKDTSGSNKKSYTFLGTDRGFVPLETEDAFLNAYYNSDVRGAANGIWTGNYKDWMGNTLYRWNQIDTGNNGPIGSPLLPRAQLGVAVVGAASATVIQGGGTAQAAAANPPPAYFKFFSNAPYVFHNGELIAADVSTQRYIRVTNPDQSYGVLNYIVNNGNQITLNGVTSIGTGTETTNFVVGALIEECNILGTRFCRTLILAQEAMACGLGAIDGTPANPQYGKRTQEILNHGVNIAIGCEQSWGCAPIKRWDGQFCGFIVLETALPQTV